MRFIRSCLCYVGPVFALIWSVAFPGGAFSDGIKSLKRPYDPVVIEGDKCGAMAGRPISNYGLFSFRDNQLAPVPFQIDEVNKKGEFVFTHGRKKGVDEDKGLFDPNDQLVFMARDSGNKINEKGLFPREAIGGAEVVLVDPLTQERAWIYLLAFPSPPLLSAIDYADYHAEQMKVRARNYLAGFNRVHPASASEYAFSREVGGDETDMIDRVKTRIKMKKFITLHVTEEKIKVTENGYIDGAVRVIINSTSTFPLVLGLSASRTKSNTIYYYGFADFPLIVDLPLLPDIFQAKVIDDMADCKGCIFYSSTNPQGHIIDGRMDESDQALNLSPFDWSVLSNDHSAFWSRLLAPPGCPVKPALYFADDQDKSDPLEDIRGETPGVGLILDGPWEAVEDYPLLFHIIHFFTRKYSPGDEKDIVNIHDHPLETAVIPIDLQ